MEYVSNYFSSFSLILNSQEEIRLNMEITNRKLRDEEVF